MMMMMMMMMMIVAPDGGPPSVNSTGISYTEISVIWTEPARYHHNGVLLGKYMTTLFLYVREKNKYFDQLI